MSWAPEEMLMITCGQVWQTVIVRSSFPWSCTARSGVTQKQSQRKGTLGGVGLPVGARCPLSEIRADLRNPGAAFWAGCWEWGRRAERLLFPFLTLWYFIPVIWGSLWERRETLPRPIRLSRPLGPLPREGPGLRQLLQNWKRQEKGEGVDGGLRESPGLQEWAAGDKAETSPAARGGAGSATKQRLFCRPAFRLWASVKGKVVIHPTYFIEVNQDCSMVRSNPTPLQIICGI